MNIAAASYPLLTAVCLDETGDMPIALQAVLLRFLDDWTVRPVGRSNRQVNVPLASATNANLDESIAKGRFRSDLVST